MKVSLNLPKIFRVNRQTALLNGSLAVMKQLTERANQRHMIFLIGSLLDTIEVGTVKGLQQIHGYLFGGLYDCRANQNPKYWKGWIPICYGTNVFARNTEKIEEMPESTFDEIADKYVEMNVAHPFLEGNGRSMRIWLDLILKKNLKLCVDYYKINKKDYLAAMEKSMSDSLK